MNSIRNWNPGNEDITMNKSLRNNKVLDTNKSEKPRYKKWIKSVCNNKFKCNNKNFVYEIQECSLIIVILRPIVILVFT